MTASYQWGYRIAFIVTGIVPLMLSTRIGWPLAYGLTAAMMVIGWWPWSSHRKGRCMRRVRSITTAWRSDP
ncbi:MAG: hypothetical protein WDN06_04220 [Asticcacaulis sp.]